MNKRGIYIARDAEGWLTFHLQKPTFNKISKGWRTKSPSTLLDQMKKAFKEIEPCTCAHIPISKDLVLSNNPSLDKRTKKPNYISSDIKDIFPELKESEDEKIRKALIDYFDDANKADENPLQNYGIHTDKVIAWLEKQGEQKPTDKVEPKFKVGDWIVDENEIVKQIGEFETYERICYFTDRTSIPLKDLNSCRLWTIEDAKDGDVLVDAYGNIGIYECHDDFEWISYCSLGCNGYFIGFKAYYEIADYQIKATCPATKEQRNLLFQKIKEKGYEWDVEKKELKKLN